MIRKTLLLTLMAILSFSAYSQTEGTYKTMVSATNGTSLDTVPGNGSRSQVLRVAGNALITIVTTVTEISGTTAGTVTLYGSLDGTNYVQIDTNVFEPTDQTAAQSYKWELEKSRYTYYKLTYAGTGTMSAKFTSGILKRSKTASVEGTLTALKSTTNATALDTVTGTASRSQVLRVPGYRDMITVVTTITEISGTTGGTAKLYGSLDGTNYVQIGADTFSPADAAGAQSHSWEFDESMYTYYKVTYTGASGQVAKLATGLLRRP